METSSNQYDRCDRCNGEGTYTVRVGIPGQDTYTPGDIVAEGDGWNARTGSAYSFAAVEWEEEPRGPFRCGACLGTGWRKPRVERPNLGEFHIHSSKATTMSMDDILDKMQLGEPDDEVRLQHE